MEGYCHYEWEQYRCRSEGRYSIDLGSPPPMNVHFTAFLGYFLYFLFLVIPLIIVERIQFDNCLLFLSVAAFYLFWEGYTNCGINHFWWQGGEGPRK